jgi:hypothetical protein
VKRCRIRLYGIKAARERAALPLGPPARSSLRAGGTRRSVRCRNSERVHAWNQHKPGATYTFNFPPMSMAMNGRDGTAAYQIGSFTN